MPEDAQNPLAAPQEQTLAGPPAPLDAPDAVHVTVNVNARWTMHVIIGPNAGRVFELNPSHPLVIGRYGHSIPLEDSKISRGHALLTPDAEEWYLTDLESANGTYLNGEPIRQRALLHEGDRIQVGDTLLEYTHRIAEGAQTIGAEAVHIQHSGSATSPVDEMQAAAADAFSPVPRRFRFGLGGILLASAMVVLLGLATSSLLLQFRAKSSTTDGQAVAPSDPATMTAPVVDSTAVSELMTSQQQAHAQTVQLIEQLRAQVADRAPSAGPSTDQIAQVLRAELQQAEDPQTAQMLGRILEAVEADAPPDPALAQLAGQLEAQAAAQNQAADHLQALVEQLKQQPNDQVAQTLDKVLAAVESPPSMQPDPALAGIAARLTEYAAAQAATGQTLLKLQTALTELRDRPAPQTERTLTKILAEVQSLPKAPAHELSAIANQLDAQAEAQAKLEQQLAAVLAELRQPTSPGTQAMLQRILMEQRLRPGPDMFAFDPEVSRIVFVVDASGSLIDTLPLVLERLKNAVLKLDATQQFTVVFFQEDQAIEVPPKGLKTAASSTRQQVAARISFESGHIRPRGQSSPVRALQLAMKYRPQLLFVVSDNIVGSGPYEMQPDQMLKLIDRLNPDRKTVISTVQLVRRDPAQTLKRIAIEHGGTYRFARESDLAPPSVDDDGPNLLEMVRDLDAKSTE